VVAPEKANSPVKSVLEAVPVEIPDGPVNVPETAVTVVNTPVEGVVAPIGPTKSVAA